MCSNLYTSSVAVWTSLTICMCAGLMRMQGKLSQASLAFLWDHQVSGKALFPAAAMLETASAAVYTALGSSFKANSTALTCVAIPAALQLLPSNSQPPEIAAILDPGNAALSIESMGSTKSRTVHLKCSVASAMDCFNASSLGPLKESTGASGRSLSFVRTQHLPAAFGEVTKRNVLQIQEFIADPAIIDNGTQVRSSSGYYP